MKKSKFIEILEEQNRSFNCNCSFDIINQISDIVFNGNELVEYEIDIIIDKLKLKINLSNIFCKYIKNLKLSEQLKRFFETKVLPVMKINRCKFNYDLMSQIRDQFIYNPSLKLLIFDHLFTNYNDC